MSLHRNSAGSPGRAFGWLWSAYAVSTLGTWFAFDAFRLIAILVLHEGPAKVSALAAAGLAAGALVAVPLGPWIEFRRKQRVMIAMDLLRFAAVMSIPIAFMLGVLHFSQLLIVSVVVAAADIAFKAASGACLKALVKPEDLLAANGRLEATTWTATMLGPPLGGAAIGMFGPVATVIVDAASYLLSALGIGAIGKEARPMRMEGPGFRFADFYEGWRYIFASAALRPLFLNTVLVNGLILATAPLLAVLMLGHLGFSPWQYGLAFGAPCAGGLIGSRLAQPAARRFGRHRVMRVAGTLRACWSIGLAFVMPGPAGLALVIALQFGLVASVGVFNPIFATYRLEHVEPDRIARTLSAWSIASNATVAILTGLWGGLANIAGTRVAIALAGVLLLATIVLLPRAKPAREARSSQLT